MSRTNNLEYEGIISDLTRPDIPRILKAFALSIIGAAFLSYLVLLIMRTNPTFSIHTSMVLTSVILLGLGGSVSVTVDYTIGFILVAFGAIWIRQYLLKLPQIPYLSELMSSVADLVNKCPSTIALNFVSVVLQLACAILFSYILLVLPFQHGLYVAMGLIIYLLFSFFWTLKTLKKVVHTVNCGVFATCFLDDASAMPRSKMLAALKRSLTTSFGSLVLGSLFTFIPMPSSIARLGHDREVENRNGGSGISAALCIVTQVSRCFLACLESLAMYSNHYAYVIVATDGQSYLEAVQTSVDLFLNNGLVNHFNETMLNRLELAIAISNTAIIGLASFGISFIVDLTEHYIAVIIGCGLVSFLIVGLVMQIVQSAAATTFVYFAKDRSLSITQDSMTRPEAVL